MNSFDLVSSLQALPETDPIEVDGIQFGPTCVNVQNNGAVCGLVTLSVPVNMGSTLIGGVGLGIGVAGSGAGSGC